MRLSNAGVALAVGVTLAALAGPAAALEPGVTVSPTSPAGQQYSYPLSVLRSQGAGQRAPSPERPTPLFGVGITTTAGHGHARALQRRATRPSRSGSRRATRQRSAPRHAVTDRATGSGRSAADRSDATAARVRTPGSALPRTGLIVLLVLVLGAGLGVGLRRIGRRD